MRQGHLREAFLACVGQDDLLSDADDPMTLWAPLADEDTLWFYDQEQQATWDRMLIPERALYLLGQLHNCSDYYLPREVVEDWKWTGKPTYDALARYLLEELKRYLVNREITVGASAH
jgi:hypothetical protein